MDSDTGAFPLGDYLSEVIHFYEQRTEMMILYGDVCLGRGLYVLYQKRLCKIEYGIKASISNVNLGLLYPSHQLILFW